MNIKTINEHKRIITGACPEVVLKVIRHTSNTAHFHAWPKSVKRRSGNGLRNGNMLCRIYVVDSEILIMPTKYVPVRQNSKIKLYCDQTKIDLREPSSIDELKEYLQLLLKGI